MPTSAGKTKMSELAIYNDLFTDDRRCLYLAPFRALVSEIEASLAPTLADVGIAVGSLYGGSEANELEVELSQIAPLVIATPEKMSAVLRMSGGRLTDFGTIILDEGHLVGSHSRGAAYELQLARLRGEILARSDSGVAAPRVIFLSAVLPNVETIASWLVGGDEFIAQNEWHPTTLRVGVFTWREDGPARLRYVRQPLQPEELEFFVPRVLEEDRWTERHPETRRNRTYIFPDRRDKASIAAALAFRYAAQGPVIVYAQQPKWAYSVAERIIERLAHAREITTNLISETNGQPLADLATYVESRLGSESVVAQALRFGVGVHHGGVPITVRLALEDAFRTHTLRLLIATSTISQGVNFPVRTVIVHSFPGSDAPIREFWNLAGRAGRATRETEGELILINTGNVSPSTLRKFLNRQNVEPAESQILEFVQELLTRYPVVTPTAIDAATQRDNEGSPSRWRDVVNAIDTQLLEIMVEDIAEQEDAVIDSLVENLLATRQARDELGWEAYIAGLQDLFRVRKEYIRTVVPDVNLRRRYSRTGVGAVGSILLDQQIPSIVSLIGSSPDVDSDVIVGLIKIACTAPELSAVDAERASALALVWLETGAYVSVWQSDDRFATVDETVSYVEQIIAYKLPWVLNGILRLLESRDIEPSSTPPERAAELIPTWIKYIPQFLRFGVRRIELVWVMSLGIPDAGFAAWVLEQYQSSTGRLPPSFSAVAGWAIESQDQLRNAAETWPPYFQRLLAAVLERSVELKRALDEEV
jgi:helicase